MAGLLGDGFDDPKSAAIMALAGGLLKGDFGGGLLGANDAFAQHKANALKTQMAQMQIENMRSEIEQRKAAVEKQQKIQELMGGMFGAGGVSAPQVSPGAFAPAVDGMGPTMPQSMVAQAAPGSRLANLGIDQIAALHAAGGPNLLDAYKWVKDPLKLEAGSTYQDRATGQERYLPKLDNGMVPIAGGGAGMMPGYAEAQARAAGMTAQAQERAKAGFDPLTIPAGPGRPNPTMTTRGAFIEGQGAPAATLPPRSGIPMGADAGRTQILGQEMDKAQAQLKAALQSGDAVAAQRAATDVASLNRELGRIGPVQTAQRVQPQPTPQSGLGLPLQSEPEAVAAKTTAEATARDVAEQRKSIMGAGFAAPTNIAKYQQIGKLLEGVDGGKFTPAGYEVASALNSLGFKVNPKLGNVQAAQAMANEAALQLRSPAGGAGMPGALSDQDRAFLSSMTPNIAQSAEGRKQVINSYVAVQQRNQQVATFARNYEKKYGKLDNGFFEQLQQWSNATPLFGGK